MNRKRGCGRVLVSGDEAVDKWGVLLCPECEAKEPPLYLRVFIAGTLGPGIKAYCGQPVNLIVPESQSES